MPSGKTDRAQRRQAGQPAEDRDSRRADVVPFDIDDARRFLKIADEHWLAALWLILLTTGLRRGEALGLA
jgi:integrase